MYTVTEWQCHSVNGISVTVCVMYFTVSKVSGHNLTSQPNPSTEKPPSTRNDLFERHTTAK